MDVLTYPRWLLGELAQDFSEKNPPVPIDAHIDSLKSYTSKEHVAGHWEEEKLALVEYQ